MLEAKIIKAVRSFGQRRINKLHDYNLKIHQKQLDHANSIVAGAQKALQKAADHRDSSVANYVSFKDEINDKAATLASV